MKFHKISKGLYVSEDKKFAITKQYPGWVIMKFEGIVNGREWYCTTHVCCKFLSQAKSVVAKKFM